MTLDLSIRFTGSPQPCLGQDQSSQARDEKILFDYITDEHYETKRADCS